MKLEYDAISPITGNKCVLEEASPHDNSISYLCMESGYTSHEHLKEDSDFQKKYNSYLNYSTYMIHSLHITSYSILWNQYLSNRDLSTIQQ